MNQSNESGINVGSGDALPDGAAQTQQNKNELENGPEDLKEDLEVKVALAETSKLPEIIWVDGYDNLSKSANVKGEEPKPISIVGKFEEIRKKVSFNPERGRRVPLLGIPVEKHGKKGHMPPMSVNEARAGELLVKIPELPEIPPLPGSSMPTVGNHAIDAMTYANNNPVMTTGSQYDYVSGTGENEINNAQHLFYHKWIQYQALRNVYRNDCLQARNDDHVVYISDDSDNSDHEYDTMLMERYLTRGVGTKNWKKFEDAKNAINLRHQKHESLNIMDIAELEECRRAKMKWENAKNNAGEENNEVDTSDTLNDEDILNLSSYEIEDDLTETSFVIEKDPEDSSSCAKEELTETSFSIGKNPEQNSFCSEKDETPKEKIDEKPNEVNNNPNQYGLALSKYPGIRPMPIANNKDSDDDDAYTDDDDADDDDADDDEEETEFTTTAMDEVD